jgi:hypothetical protein
VVLTDIWRRLPGAQKALCMFILRVFFKVCDNKNVAVVILINYIINIKCDWNSVFKASEELSW